MRRGSRANQATLRVPYAAVVPARDVAAMAFALPLLAHLVDTARLVLTGGKGATALLVAAVMLLVRYECARRAFSTPPIWRTLSWLVAGALASSGLELEYWLYGLRGTIPDATWEATESANFLAGPVMQVAYGLIFGLLERGFAAESSDESADQAVIAAAVWLGVPWFSMASLPSLILSRTSMNALGSLAFHLITTVPVAIALVAHARLILRRRWVARVSLGQDPRWRLAACDGPVPVGLPSIARTDPGAPDLVLVMVHPAEDPHRSVELLEPRATLCARRARRWEPTAERTIVSPPGD